MLHLPARVSRASPASTRMHTADATAKMLDGAGRRTGERPHHQQALACICSLSLLSGSTFLVPEGAKDEGYPGPGADLTSDGHPSSSHTTLRYHSSHFTAEETESEPQRFYVTKHWFMEKGEKHQQECLLREAHSSQGDEAPADLPGKHPAFGPRGIREP